MTIVDALVGLVMLAVGMVGIAGAITQGAMRGAQAGVRTGRMTATLSQLERLARLPFDSIPAVSGCVSVSVGAFPHQRCISFGDSTGGTGYRRVRLIIDPDDFRVRPETTFLVRTRGVSVNPLGS